LEGIGVNPRMEDKCSILPAVLPDSKKSAQNRINQNCFLVKEAVCPE